MSTRIHSEEMCFVNLRFWRNNLCAVSSRCHLQIDPLMFIDAGDKILSEVREAFSRMWIQFNLPLMALGTFVLIGNVIYSVKLQLIPLNNIHVNEDGLECSVGNYKRIRTYSVLGYV